MFHKWLNGDENYPQCVKWFKFSNKKNNTPPEDLLTQSEVKRLIKACDSPKNKAFVACLWDSGAGIGEIDSIKIKNVSFDEYERRISLLGMIAIFRECLAWEPGALGIDSRTDGWL